MDGLAGTDFFTAEVLAWRGLVTYYVLFFRQLETRRVTLAGVTQHPTEEWITQVARNAIDGESGCRRQHRYVLHDRDTRPCAEFRETLETGGVKCLPLPPRSPDLNTFSERWVRSVESECLSKLILFGESSLRRPWQVSVGINTARGTIKDKTASCCFLGQLCRNLLAGGRFDATSGWVGCSSAVDERRDKGRRAIRMLRFYWAGILCLLLAVLKLTIEEHWSWWRVLLPLWVVLSHNALYRAVGFVWFFFADSLLGRIEVTGETTRLWLRSGRWALIFVSGVLSVMCQLLFWPEVISPGNRRTWEE